MIRPSSRPPAPFSRNRGGKSFKAIRRFSSEAEALQHYNCITRNPPCDGEAATKSLDPFSAPCYIQLMKHTVTFLPDNVSVTVDDNTNLFRAVKASGVYVLSSCGGKGNCGKCKVIIKEGTVESGKSRSYLSPEEAERGYVLACLSRVKSDLVVEIPQESRMQAKHKIATGANTDELIKLMRSAGGCLESRISRIYLELGPPTIDDNIADYERVRRALDKAGFDASHLHMNYLVLKKLSHVLQGRELERYGIGLQGERGAGSPGHLPRQRHAEHATARQLTSAPPRWWSTSWT